MDSQCTLIFLLLCIWTWCSSVSGLECYACHDQPNNREKCVKTVVQCEQHHDVCETSVAWGIPIYWTPVADRIHSISKQCGVRSQCEVKKKNMMSFCKRDWYSDWRCIECCSGDKCNYYVTLGASSAQISVTVLVLGALLAWSCHQMSYH